MQKSAHLFAIHSAWNNCQGCALAESRHNVVFGYGNPDAQVMIIGEAPGEQEDASGFPFVGKAGLLLDQYLGQVSSREEVIEAIGELNAIKGSSAAVELRRNEKRILLRELLTQEFYFTNAVMCHPPENRDPLPVELEACRSRLLEQIYTIDPVLIIVAGRVAAEALLQKKVAITAARGELFDLEFQGRNEVIKYTMMAVLHPAYLARKNDMFETKKTYNDFLRAMNLLDEYNKRHYGIQPSKLRPRVEP